MNDLDYEASIKKLSELLPQITEDAANLKLKREELLQLSRELERVAESLADGKWFFLENAFDQPNYSSSIFPTRDGMVTRVKIDSSNEKDSLDPEKLCFQKYGAYKNLIGEIKRLGEVAILEANNLPARKKNVDTFRIEYAASAFLYIRKQCKLAPPKKYELDSAVLDFLQLLRDAGIDRSSESLKAHLAHCQIDESQVPAYEALEILVYKSVG